MTALHRGIVTLTALILLSSALIILFLFNDELLRSYSAIRSQRSLYVKQNMQLQQLIHQQKDTACLNVPLDLAQNTYQVELSLPQSIADSIHYYIGCQRVGLFKKAPTKKTSEGELDQFIYRDKIQHYSSTLLAPEKLTANNVAKLYWINGNQTTIELDGDIYALILAEGNLIIQGKGNIRGAVVVGGTLQTEDKVRIAYNKDTVQKLVKQYSQWQLAEQSWHDFKVEKK